MKARRIWRQADEIDLSELPPLAPGGLTIQPVADRASLVAWTSAFIQGYEISEIMAQPLLSFVEGLGTDLTFRYYAGVFDGQLVATSTLFLGAGVAGIYNVATVPEARRHGVGTALTLAPLFDARNMGYRAGMLQSSDIAYGDYERMGFRRYYAPFCLS